MSNSPWSGARRRSSRAVLLHTLHEFSQPATGDTYLFLIVWWPFHTEKRKTGDYMNAHGASPNGRFLRTTPQIAVTQQCWGLLRERFSSAQRMNSMKCTECVSLWGSSSPHQVSHQCLWGWTECVNVGSRQTEDQAPGELQVKGPQSHLGGQLAMPCSGCHMGLLPGRRAQRDVGNPYFSTSICVKSGSRS